MDRATRYEHVSLDIDDGVATVELRRPEVHNALDTATMFYLRRAFDEANQDRDIDVMIVIGQGEEAFSAGADIEEYARPAVDHPHQRAFHDVFYEDVYSAVRTLHCPTIAAIDGYCLGGGLILAMYCDLRIATERSTFGVPVTAIGQVPTGDASRRAVDLVGEAKAKELVLTADRIDAADAERIGLVNTVVPSEVLWPEVSELVDSIQAAGREAVKNAKRAINFTADAPVAATARDYEAALWWDQFDPRERERLVDDFILTSARKPTTLVVGGRACAWLFEGRTGTTPQPSGNVSKGL